MSAPEPDTVLVHLLFIDDIRPAPARRLGWALRCRTLRSRRLMRGNRVRLVT